MAQTQKAFVGDEGTILRGIGTVDLNSATELKFRIQRGSSADVIEVTPEVSEDTNLIYETTSTTFNRSGRFQVWAHRNLGAGGKWTKILDFWVFEVPAVTL